ncbi:MAG: glycosyltransferase family 2 protein [Planctomycetota bacterium]|jgi:undecaprenyl-phosphate 4-deoxy-4-formamido-L-arabinose transferase
MADPTHSTPPAAPNAAPRFTVVVPVFHGGATLRELLRRSDAMFEGLDGTHEYVLVDDCSQDDSWEVAAALAGERSDVRAYRLMRNFGQHNALMCGFKHSRGELIVTLDDDLQNPPEEVPAMVEALIAGDHDVVFGYYAERGHNVFRNATSNIARWLLTRSIPRLNPYYSNFRIIRRIVIDAVTQQRDDFLYIDGFITWATDRTSHVVVRHEARTVGRSNYTLRKLITYFGVILFTFTVLPLRVLAITGSLLSVTGLGIGVYYLIRKLTGHVTIPGFAALIVAIMVIGGIQLLSLAVIGEYVGKIFLKQSRKPQFLIREARGE